jgi:hypothetical protein
MTPGANLEALAFGTLVLFCAPGVADAQQPVPGEPQRNLALVSNPERGSAAPSDAPHPAYGYQQPYRYGRPEIDGRAEQEKRSEWYGWQMLLTDASAVGLLAAAVATDSTELGIASLGTYLVGGPIVHGLHRREGMAFASAGIRIGAPIVGAFVGASMEDCKGGYGYADGSGDHDSCGATGIGLGILAGAGTAIAIDAAVFAREKRTESAPGLIRAGTVHMTPGASLTRGRSELYIYGNF